MWLSHCKTITHKLRAANWKFSRWKFLSNVFRMTSNIRSVHTNILYKNPKYAENHRPLFIPPLTEPGVNCQILSHITKRNVVRLCKQKQKIKINQECVTPWYVSCMNIIRSAEKATHSINYLFISESIYWLIPITLLINRLVPIYYLIILSKNISRHMDHAANVFLLFVTWIFN